MGQSNISIYLAFDPLHFLPFAGARTIDLSDVSCNLWVVGLLVVSRRSVWLLNCTPRGL